MKIKLIEDRTSLQIDVQGYEREAAKDPDDANWLSAHASIEAGPFRGSFPLSLTTYDLTALKDRVTKVMAGENVLAFEATEGNLNLDMKSMPSGRVSLSGSMQVEGNALRFEMNCSAGDMAEFGDQLAEALRHFPVRQAVDA